MLLAVYPPEALDVDGPGVQVDLLEAERVLSQIRLSLERAGFTFATPQVSGDADS